MLEIFGIRVGLYKERPCARRDHRAREKVDVLTNVLKSLMYSRSRFANVKISSRFHKKNGLKIWIVHWKLCQNTYV